MRAREAPPQQHPLERLLAELGAWLAQLQAPDDVAPPGDQRRRRRDGCAEAAELLEVLEQYPGGLTRCAVLSALQRSLLGGGAKRGGAPGAEQAPGVVALAACLGGGGARPPTPVVVAGAVREVVAGGGEGTGGPALLQLVDACAGAAGAPAVAMFVHSAHAWLLKGPRALLVAGRRLRAATTLVRPLGAAGGAPPLMPTTALALLVPPRDWDATLARLPGPHGQLYRLPDLLAGGPGALAEERCALNGWLLATVAAVGQVERGHNAPGAASSRTWTTCSVELRGDATTDGSTGGALRWLLLDDAVRYASLLRAGEQVALGCPTVRSWLPQPGAPPELVLETSCALTLLVRSDGGEASGEAAADDGEARGEAADGDGAGSPAEPGSAGGAPAFRPVGTLAAGERELLLCGVVSGLRLCHAQAGVAQPAGRVLRGTLADTPADAAAGRGVELALRLAPVGRSRLLRELRDGHTLLLARARAAAAPGGGLCVEWAEDVGGGGADLCCRLALLATPCLQQGVDVAQLAAGGDALLALRGPLFARGVIRAAEPACCQLHRECGRAAAPAAEMLLDSDGEDSPAGSAPHEAPGGDDSSDAAAGLWSCAACGVDFGAADLQPGWAGWVLLGSDGAEGAEGAQAPAARLAVDPRAWGALVAACGTPLSRDVGRLAARLVGLRVAASVYAAPGGGCAVACCAAEDQLPPELREQALQEKRSQGGYRFDSPADRAHIREQRAAIWAWFRGLGGNLIKHGVNLTKVPLPVELCEARSFLARLTDSWAYHHLLHAAAACSDPVERLKLVVAFAVGGMRQQVSCDKPFNPILGETLQGSYPCGCQVFAEQVSHHPPVSCWQVLDANGQFEYTGSSCWSATFTGNSVKGSQYGDSRLRFASDGATVTWTLPNIHIRGVLFGDRVVKYHDTLLFEDDTNGLRCGLSVDPAAPRKGLVKRIITRARHPRGKHGHDALLGELARLGAPAGRGGQRAEQVLDSCSGTWLTQLCWDKGVRSTVMPEPAPPAAAAATAAAADGDGGSVVCHSIGSFSSSSSLSDIDEAASDAGGRPGAAANGDAASSASGRSGGSAARLTASALAAHAASREAAAPAPAPAPAGPAPPAAGGGAGMGAPVASAATLTSSDATGHRSGRGIGVTKRLWDAAGSQVSRLVPLSDQDPRLLPSDHRYRPDVQALGGGSPAAAQHWKLVLEQRQRRDRALRGPEREGHGTEAGAGHHRRSSTREAKAPGPLTASPSGMGRPDPPGVAGPTLDVAVLQGLETYIATESFLHTLEQASVEAFDLADRGHGAHPSSAWPPAPSAQQQQPQQAAADAGAPKQPASGPAPPPAAPARRGASGLFARWRSQPAPPLRAAPEQSVEQGAAGAAAAAWAAAAPADAAAADGAGDAASAAFELVEPPAAPDAAAAAPEPFVLVSGEDAIEAMAYYIALFLSRAPEARAMDPKQLQAALQQTFTAIRRRRYRVILDWGTWAYRCSAVSYSALQLYSHPWLVRAVVAAIWTSSKMALGFLW
ncbi:osbI [Scenedesmus sp. PABB004]|nr:osbI [Scenedesmus sp. PABB004]